MIKKITVEQFKDIYGGYTQGGIITSILKGFGKYPADEQYGYFNVGWTDWHGASPEGVFSSSLIVEEFVHYVQWKRDGLIFPVRQLFDTIRRNYYKAYYEQERINNIIKWSEIIR